MAEVLVAYFSRSGTAERLARDLAARLDADLDEIHPASSYAGLFGFIKGGYQATRGRTPAFDCKKTPGHYARVVVATPVWAAHPSAPLRSYLVRFAGQFRNLSALWVSGSGQPYEDVGREIGQLAGRPLSASASFSEREARAGEGPGAKLDGLARAVKAA